MGVMSFLAKLGNMIPSPSKPARRPDLKYRITFTVAAVAIFFAMASVSAYPVQAGVLSFQPSCR
jgi:preprotein translocase subunit SecY